MTVDYRKAKRCPLSPVWKLHLTGRRPTEACILEEEGEGRLRGRETEEGNSLLGRFEIVQDGIDAW